MRPLFAHLNNQQVQTYGLVLSAVGIPHRIHSRNHVWQIDVPDAYRRKAVASIAHYLAENKKSAKIAVPVHQAGKSYSALYAVSVLITLHGAMLSGYEQEVFYQTYGADAWRIASGQIYRCITALLFHADWAHLLANTAGLLLFGTVVARACGWGVGWLLILAAAAAGNWLTALWYQHDHLSIGASTAVFAAVGISAALAFNLRIRQDRWRQAWLPLAGGLALLGFVGTAPHTDLMAHLFGFLSGVGLGGLYTWRVHNPIPWPGQLVAVSVLTALVSGSWVWGLYSG